MGEMGKMGDKYIILVQPLYSEVPGDTNSEDTNVIHGCTFLLTSLFKLFIPELRFEMRGKHSALNKRLCELPPLGKGALSWSPAECFTGQVKSASLSGV
jgi:hypothetical protein